VMQGGKTSEQPQTQQLLLPHLLLLWKLQMRLPGLWQKVRRLLQLGTTMHARQRWTVPVQSAARLLQQKVARRLRILP